MIKLTSIKASFPLLKADSVVTHVTPRRSMAFEWLLIQLIAKIEQHPEYREMSVEELISKMFGIEDTDTMIKPLIPGLITAGAIKVYGYSDEIKMSQFLMGNFELTNEGRTMQMLGQLPGANTQNSIIAFYNPATNELWVNKSPYPNTTDKPNGIEMLSLEDDVKFPVVSLMYFLKELRDNEERRPDWMSENTEISDITEKTSVLWYNKEHDVTLDDSMQLGIDGLEGSAAERVLDKVAPTFLSERELPRVKFNNPGEEIKRFALISDEKSVENWINKDFRDKACFVDQRFDIDILSKDGKLFEKEKGFCVKVINNAGKFKCEPKKVGGKKTNRMVLSVSIPESLLPDGTFFVSDSQSYCAGRIPFSYKSNEYDADVIYEPNCKENYNDGEQPYSMSSLFCQMVENHYKESNDVVFALYPVNRTKFWNYLNKIVDEETALGDKMAKITQLNNISYALINEKCLKEDIIVHFLTNSVKYPTVDEAYSAIEMYSGINGIGNNDVLMRELIKSTLKNTENASSLDELYDMMDYIGTLGKNFIAYLRNEKAAAHLYSNDIKRELIGRFDSEEIYAEIEEYTDAEKNLLEMRRQCDRLNDTLPEFSVFERVSYETCLRIVLSKNNKLKKIHDIYTIWSEELDKFSEVFGDIGIIRDSNPAFSNAISNFEKVGKVLSKFYLDTSTFGEICIADTSALLQSDLLIERFEGLNKTPMLIIPQTVLEELDGLKKDSEVGAKAQAVIRSINAKKDKEFLNISESSSPDLLPDDFDKTLNDNKILSVALKYQVKNPTILTNDINLSNKAASLGIASMTEEDYFQSRIEKFGPKKAEESSESDKQSPKKKGKK